MGTSSTDTHPSSSSICCVLVASTVSRRFVFIFFLRCGFLSRVCLPLCRALVWHSSSGWSATQRCPLGLSVKFCSRRCRVPRLGGDEVGGLIRCSGGLFPDVSITLRVP